MSQSGDMTARLLIEIPYRFPGIWAWRSNPVNAMAEGRGGQKRLIRSGLPGEPDISATISPCSRFGGIEVKAGRDVMRESQINWRNKILAVGGWYIICRDVDVTLDELAVLYRGEGN